MKRDNTRTIAWKSFTSHGLGGKRVTPVKHPPLTLRGSNINTYARMSNRHHGAMIDDANSRQKPNIPKQSSIVRTKPCKCAGVDVCTHGPAWKYKPETMAEKMRDAFQNWEKHVTIYGLTHDPKTHLRYSSRDISPTPRKEVIQLTGEELRQWELHCQHYDTVERAGELFTQLAGV